MRLAEATRLDAAFPIASTWSTRAVDHRDVQRRAGAEVDR